MLNEPCLKDMLNRVTALLHAENMWTASNAALVLARYFFFAITYGVNTKELISVVMCPHVTLFISLTI